MSKYKKGDNFIIESDGYKDVYRITGSWHNPNDERLYYFLKNADGYWISRLPEELDGFKRISTARRSAIMRKLDKCGNPKEYMRLLAELKGAAV
jgi:hypothetical protein